jgi:hypothetical protein
MDNTFQFVAADPQKAMRTFTAGLRRAVKISSCQMNTLVEQDNTQRETQRTESGQAKRGPKPKR